MTSPIALFQRTLPYRGLLGGCVVLLVAFLSTPLLAADPPGRPLLPREGMWIPSMLEGFNIEEMQEMGFQLEAEDVFSPDGKALNGAIVHFGGFCTASVISEDGLILTNHHCGYGAIQSHSSVENDLLTNGFMAQTRNEELRNEDLTATFVRDIRNVTKEVRQGISDTASGPMRATQIMVNIRKLEARATEGNHYEAEIKAFYGGNEYYLFLKETFRDVRLVGAPPSSIGKFGGDTDNWMWPRHTGDFSLFRIYAGPDNKPADYSPENKPYTPKHVMPVSTGGVNEGDFTMIFGFPGRTSEYLTSWGVALRKEVTNPIRIGLREKRLGILQSYMNQSDANRIRYAATYASISNGYKKWIGQNRGLRRLRTVQEKRELESDFRMWAAQDPDRAERYGNLTAEYEDLYDGIEAAERSKQYVFEAIWPVPMLRMGFRVHQQLQQVNQEKDTPENFAETMRKRMVNYHADNLLAVDREMATEMLKEFMEGVDDRYLPREVQQQIQGKYDGSYERFINDVFENSLLTDSARINQLAGNPKRLVRKLKGDPLVELGNNLIAVYTETLREELSTFEARLAELDYYWIQGQREMFEGRKKLYPDANSTMRISYGKVEPYYPYDGVFYQHQTTLDGVYQKYKPGDGEFDVPDALLELYENQDFAPYGSGNTMPVCFIASNHTSGGNSGSPIINARGELIGLNFDRNWEGTMSDIDYDRSLVRNISVDIRYVLFIIDKFYKADHIIREINLAG